MLPPKKGLSQIANLRQTLAKKADGRLFFAGNLRFSFASTIKYAQIMDENCGVKPQSKNQGGVDLHKSVKNGQLKKRASYGRIDISTIGGIFYAQRISTHTEL